MRLAEVRREGTLMHRLELVWWRLRAGLYATDLHRAMRYRPAFFGRAFASYVQSVLRQPGSGTWTIGERELLATVASRMFECEYCLASHREVAALEMPPAVVDAVVRDWRTAPIPQRLKAVIGLYQKLAESSSDLGPEDIVPLRAAGISDAGILEAIHIRTVFAITTRLADALGFEIPTLKVLQQRARTSRKADPTR